MFESEVRFVSFGDKRLWKRFLSVGSAISKKMHSILTCCFDNKADRDGAYRFFSNEKVDAEKILEAHFPVLKERVSKTVDPILMIQDSSTFNYSEHSCTKNLGRINTYEKPGHGVIVHTSLCINANKNISFGIANQSYFIHHTSNKDHLPIEEKESYRWIEHLRHNNSISKNAIHICDREGDIFEFFQEAISLNASFIIRQSHDRALGKTMYGKKDGFISDKLSNTAVAGSCISIVQGESVELTFKFKKVNIAPPQRTVHQQQDRIYKSMNLNVVQVEGVLSDNRLISWRLLTNLEVTDLEDAKKIVCYYTQRWHIESFHKALKTGFSLEEARLEDGERIKSLIALVSIEASRVYSLLYNARLTTDIDVSNFFLKDELEIIMTLMKKTITPSLLEIVYFIANKGGFIKTKKYPYPGILTFFRGWNIIQHQIGAIRLVRNR